MVLIDPWEASCTATDVRRHRAGCGCVSVESGVSGGGDGVRNRWGMGEAGVRYVRVVG